MELDQEFLPYLDMTDEALIAAARGGDPYRGGYAV